VLGLPGPGLAGVRSNARSTASYAAFSHLEAPSPVGGDAKPNWKLGMAVVAEYYDAVCLQVHNSIFDKMEWRSAGPKGHNYLTDLKKLKAKSKRDISVLQSRAQTAGLSALGMTNSLGFTAAARTANLGHMCIGSLFDSLPQLDSALEQYIGTFHAPNVSVFLRLVRCTNLLAFEHLAKMHGAPALKDEFQRRLRHFPLGTAADLDYIMQYTASNAKNVHSIYLKPAPRPATQSANVGRSRAYVWVSDLLDAIASTPSSELDAMLPLSPLARKLLLCHEKVFALLMSVRVVMPQNDLPPVTPVENDIRDMQKRILRGLMQDKTVYFVGAVNRHVEVSYAARKEDARGDQSNALAKISLRAYGFDSENEMDDAEHDELLKTAQISFTRLTWPLRDLNVYTRISVPHVNTDGDGFQSVSFPGNLSFAQGAMHPHETQIFDWLEAEQTRLSKRHQHAMDSLETGTAALTLPRTLIPDEMQGRVLDSKQVAMLRLLQPASFLTAYTDNVVWSAWRWKSLLMQMTLLSALNGICDELSTPNEKKSWIQKYTKVGTERQTEYLILQDFIMDKKAVQDVKFLVRERIFDMQKTEKVLKQRGLQPDTDEVDLLKCTFSIKQNGTRELSKLVKRVADGPHIPYFVKGSGVKLHTVQIHDRSRGWKSTASELARSPEDWEDWYDF